VRTIECRADAESPPGNSASHDWGAAEAVNRSSENYRYTAEQRLLQEAFKQCSDPLELHMVSNGEEALDFDANSVAANDVQSA
jgi:hypothetical protein